MQVIKSAENIGQLLDSWRSGKHRIALVPTMGNLHAGHLSLVKKAVELADRTIVTIFVNPTQFVQGEDLSSYPRTFDQDMALLGDYPVDMVFAPDNSQMYFGNAIQTRVTVPDLENILCGKSRPGHFAGVATVVTKLFNLLRPDIAVFGEKDFQQLHVIRCLTRDLFFPIEIIGMPIVREADGLAMSSRNTYLNSAERKHAVELYQTLRMVAENIQRGDQNFNKLESEAVNQLQHTGFVVDYVSVRDAETLGEPGTGTLVILAAATLGKARLIDNIVVKR